jgi:hypothetical protein
MRRPGPPRYGNWRGSSASVVVRAAAPPAGAPAQLDVDALQGRSGLRGRGAEESGEAEDRGGEEGTGGDGGGVSGDGGGHGASGRPAKLRGLRASSRSRRRRLLAIVSRVHWKPVAGAVSGGSDGRSAGAPMGGPPARAVVLFPLRRRCRRYRRGPGAHGTSLGSPHRTPAAHHV